MAKVKLFKQGFVAGELSPNMFSRVEDVSYHHGLAICKNFLVTPEGTVKNRAGFKFVREAKHSSLSTRLIPFSFSARQTMILEFGNGYVRFHTQGATLLDASGNPYEVVTPYQAADLFDLHHVQSADVLTLVHENYPVKELRRYGATDWRLIDVEFVPGMSAPDNVVATANRVTRNSSTTTTTTQGGTSTTSTTNATNTEINIDYYYAITAVSGGKESIKSQVAQCVNDLFSTGSTNIVTWDAVADAEHYCVYKKQSGLFGFVGYSDNTTFTDDAISPDMSKTPPIYKPVMNEAGKYPSVVAYYQQRRVFAGSVDLPHSVWMTKSGTESDMSYSLPTREDDRIEFRLAAREVNAIRHIVPMGDLLVLTGAAEWRVSSSGNKSLTAATIDVSPQSYIGANKVTPVIVNNTAIYIAARGNHVRELGYNDNAGGYVTGDISLRAAHLFDGKEIVAMAHSKAPYPIVWFVSGDGSLLGLTYIPEQKVYAWHRHETDGEIESCAAVSEGKEDILYVVVKRKINGEYRRYVERMQSRAFPSLEHSFLLDSGLSYQGLPVATLHGLEHLEGMEVSVLADGAVHASLVVNNGEITLDCAASIIHVGLPITADIKTLPLVGQIDTAYGKARAKNINKIWLDIVSSSGVFAGADESTLVEFKQRKQEPLGTPPALKTEEIELTTRGQWNQHGQVLIRQTAPLPLAVTGLTIEAAI